MSVLRIRCPERRLPQHIAEHDAVIVPTEDGWALDWLCPPCDQAHQLLLDCRLFDTLRSGGFDIAAALSDPA